MKATVYILVKELFYKQLVCYYINNIIPRRDPFNKVILNLFPQENKNIFPKIFNMHYQVIFHKIVKQKKRKSGRLINTSD